MKTRLSRLIPCAILVCLAATPAAFAQLLRTIDAGGGLYIQQVGGRALVREPSGEVAELDMPQGATIRRLERLETGWIAAGEIDALGYTELFLLLDDGGERSLVPVPSNDEDQVLRINPVPLVDDGKLVGLAWIAGSRVRTGAVYAAAWTGDGWTPAELVSPIGPGTQIGLVGAVLADDSWLLVWSAFDGEDDEIVWSRRGNVGWETPSSVHPGNEHPDIVPSVVPTDAGALAAWSSSDGDTYRVRLALFDGRAWREKPILGPNGSVRATLTPRDGGAYLLYRAVVPPTWIVVELDLRGGMRRQASLAHEPSFQPGLVPRVDGAPAFEWPGTDIASPIRVETDWQ